MAKDNENTPLPNPDPSPNPDPQPQPSTKPLVEFDGKSKKQIGQLQERITKFELSLQSLVDENKQLKQYVETLRVLPGAGITGGEPKRTLLDEVNEILEIE